MSLKIGQLNHLIVSKFVDFGAYLDPLDEDYPEILLPKKYVPDNLELDDELPVFIYSDSEDRIIATTQQPTVTVGDFALLTVEDINHTGAFLDWGLDKQLLVPFSAQPKRFQLRKKYLVYAHLDEKDRVVGSAKLSQFLDQTGFDYCCDDRVDAMVMAKTTIGYKIIINKSHTGMIYDSEVFSRLAIGQKVQVKIQKIREDGKIDCQLCHLTNELLYQNILDELEQQKGELLLSDKSSPEKIYQVFGVSKKQYKKVLGNLYKDKKILISEQFIRLIKN